MKTWVKIVVNLITLLLFTGLIWIIHSVSENHYLAEEDKYIREAILDLLDLNDHVPDMADRDDWFQRHVSVEEEHGIRIYKPAITSNGPAMVFEIAGPSAFGMANGILAVDEKKENITGIQMIRDGMSPGYGRALLASDRWLERVQGQPLFPPSSSGVSYTRKEKYVDGTTGASVSIKAASRLNNLFNSSISRFVGGGADLEPLELDLTVDAVTRATPGYPKGQITPPHLKAEIRRPAFLAPPDPRLLSVGKPVTASIEIEPIIGELEQITDGIKTCTEFDYVELDPGPQWVQVDLEQEETIYLVVVWHFYKNPVIYNDVIVQLSNDEQFKQGVITVYNNDHDNSSGQGAGADSAYYARWWGEFADARGPAYKGIPARYVRVYTNGGTGMEDTRFVEVEVYGK